MGDEETNSPLKRALLDVNHDLNSGHNGPKDSVCVAGIEGSSSATDGEGPTPDDNSKKPNNTVDDDPDFKATSASLIQKLLQLSSPRMDAKIVSVLLLDGMMDIFMSHITRLEEASSSQEIDLRSISLAEKVRYAAHTRDVQDVLAVKRSYHAMELLCGTSINHYRVQDARLGTIATRLLDVFLPRSQGNLNHFGKIFQHLVRRHPLEILDLVIMKDSASLLMDYMMPYVGHGQVLDAVLALLFPRDAEPETRQKREECHARLAELGFIKWFLTAFDIKQHPDFVEGALDLLLRIIEEGSQIDGSQVLFKEIQNEDGSHILKTLVEHIANTRPSRIHNQGIRVLRALVTCGSPPTRASSTLQPIQGPLYSVCIRTRQLLSEHIPDICEIVIQGRNSNSTKQCPLTITDLELLEVIYHTLPDSPDKVRVLDRIPPVFWRILVNSFFEKTSSSIYHTLFYRIFVCMLNINYEPSLTVLLRKQKLVTRMIDVYENKSELTDIRGFILLMLNHLRLMSDADNSGLVHRIMSSHPRFQEFLPTLRADTLAQTETKYPWNLESCARPAPHLGPIPPLRPSIMFSSYNSATLPLMGGAADSADDMSGIDLGSDFAHCLGFDDTDRTDEPGYQSNHQSRRNSIHSSSGEESCYSSESDSRPSSPTTNMLAGGDFLVFESLTPEPSSSSKKTKKKKKKKRNPPPDFIAACEG